MISDVEKILGRKQCVSGMKGIITCNVRIQPDNQEFGQTLGNTHVIKLHNHIKYKLDEHSKLQPSKTKDVQKLYSDIIKNRIEYQFDNPDKFY